MVIWNHGQLIRRLDGRSQPWPCFSSQLSLRDRLVSRRVTRWVTRSRSRTHRPSATAQREIWAAWDKPAPGTLKIQSSLLISCILVRVAHTFIYRLNTILSARDRRIRPIIYVTPNKPQALFPSYFTPMQVRSNCMVQECFV